MLLFSFSWTWLFPPWKNGLFSNDHYDGWVIHSDSNRLQTHHHFLGAVRSTWGLSHWLPAKKLLQVLAKINYIPTPLPLELAFPYKLGSFLLWECPLWKEGQGYSWGRVLSWNNALSMWDFCVQRRKQRLGVGLCCVAWLAQHSLTDLLLSWQRSSSIVFQGAVPVHSLPRELCGPPPGCGRRRRENKMVIVDADLLVFMCLLSIFFLTLQFLSDTGTCD